MKRLSDRPCFGVNDPGTSAIANCEFIKQRGTTVVTITNVVAVPAGEQLLLEYGEAYWGKRGRPAGPPPLWVDGRRSKKNKA